MLIGSIDPEGNNWKGIGQSNNWKHGSNKISARFTVPSGVTRIRIEFCSPKHADAIANWKSPQLELASTFDAAVSGGGSGSSPGTPCRDRNGIRRAGGAR